MQILVTGATGLVGSTLVPALREAGHEVRRLVRRESQIQPGDVLWEPLRGQLEQASLEGIEAAVHLAGESVASGFWTAAKKESIRRSRVDGTRILCECLARMEAPPSVVVCASAVGFYGSRGEEVLTEESAPGSGFLAEVCQQWEASASAAVERGIRVAHLRFGLVLSEKGGALRKMLPAFRLGGGGPIGNGKQYVSWISLDDTARVIQHVLADEHLAGPINAVAPHSLTNAEFTRTLGRVLRRPTVLRVPAFAIHMVLGEMADELLLASARVQPAKLVSSGYTFRHPELEPALRELLDPKAAR
jgi:uncharacterized protein (TIGR01777 family)